MRYDWVELTIEGKVSESRKYWDSFLLDGIKHRVNIKFNTMCGTKTKKAESIKKLCPFRSVEPFSWSLPNLILFVSMH